METSLIIIPSEGLEQIRFAQTFLSTAEAVRITSQGEAQGAIDQAKRVKECAKQLGDYRKTLTGPLDEQKKAIMDAFRPAVEGLERAEKLLKGAYATWMAEQERLAAEAEKRRRAQEAEDRKAREAEQANAAQLLQQAEEAAGRGDYAASEALEEQAAAAQAVAEPVAVMTPVAPVKARGAGLAKKWKCKVIDPALVPREWCIPNQQALDAYAQSMKGMGTPPAGCEFYVDANVSLR